jgi:hypothetical protein
MYLDAQLRFSNAQQVTTGSDSGVASENIIDWNDIRDIGSGRPLYIVLLVTTAMTDSGSNSAMVATLETDDNSSFSSATTTQTLLTIPAVSAAGTARYAQIYPGAANERYLRLKYTSTNGALTTGNFTAFITTDIDNFVAYADGLTFVNP